MSKNWRKELKFRRKKKPYVIQLYLKINGKLVKMSPKGFPSLPELTWNETMSVLEFFYQCRHLVFWAVGDLIRYAIEKFGVSLSFATKTSPIPIITLSKIKSAADEIPFEDRTIKLHPHVQRYIYSMNDKQAAATILQKAEEEGWTLSQICEVRELFAPPMERPMGG